MEDRQRRSGDSYNMEVRQEQPTLYSLYRMALLLITDTTVPVKMTAMQYGAQEMCAP